MSAQLPDREVLQARKDFNSHVALVYAQVPHKVRPADVHFIAFDAEGPQKFVLAEDQFSRTYNRQLEKPWESAALSFLRAAKSAYLPGDGVAKLLTEIAIMTVSQQTADHLKDSTMAELVAIHNQLATVAGKNAVKEFKSKGLALNRIQILMDAASGDTPKQAATRKDKAAAAGAKAAPKGKVAKKAAAPAAKGKAKAPASPKAKAGKQAAKGEGKPRGQGIGAFCSELILKGKSNEEVLGAVQAKFPDAATSASSVAWYRNKLKSEGKLS